MKRFLSTYGHLFIGGLLVLLATLIHSHLLSLGLTLAFGIYAFFQPKKALLMLLVYVPTRPLITEYASELKGIEDAIILFSLLRVLFNSRMAWKTIFQLKLFEWAFLLYCVFGSFVGYFMTGVPLTAVIFQSRSLLLFFLLFYIIRRLDLTKEDFKSFAWVLFTMGVVLSLHGWVEKLSIRSWLMPYTWQVRPLSSTNRIRIYGLIDNPNTLAIFLGFVYLFTTYLKTFYTSKSVRILLNVGATIFLGTLILTWSRGTFIAFVFIAILYFLLSRSWRFLKQTVVSVVASILIIVIPIMMLTNLIENTDMGKTQNQIKSQYNQTDTSASQRLTGTLQKETISQDLQTGRLFFIEKGFQYFKDHPITGTGFDTFGDSATKSYPSPLYDKYKINEKIHMYTDDQYIEVIAQTGLIGVLLFAVFLLNMLSAILKKRKEAPGIGNVLLALLIGIFLMGVYYNIWELDMMDLLFMPILAVAFPLQQPLEND